MWLSAGDSSFGLGPPLCTIRRQWFVLRQSCLSSSVWIIPLGCNGCVCAGCLHSVAPCSHCSSRRHLPLLGLLAAAMPQQAKKQCSRHGCWNDAASHRARFCMACFKKNAAACGRLRGNLEKGKKKCSGHGCRNDVQGSRWARFFTSCFKKKRLKVMLAAGHKDAFLGKNCVPTLMVLKRFLQNRGIHVGRVTWQERPILLCA